MVVVAAWAGSDESIRVADGEIREESISSLNGTIDVGDGATVRDCRSVNGSITLGEDARAGDLSAVNGAVEIGSGSEVDTVSAVNGEISLDRASASEVSTVNGSIELVGSEVTGDVKTVNGDIELSLATKVRGDIVIGNRGQGSDHRGAPLRIRVVDGSVVEGDVIVEDPGIKVELILSGGGKVLGRAEHATIVED
jgi:DUF4097 and DUF4098 domain-containing protein YvlB